jgi:hypothetical protein
VRYTLTLPLRSAASEAQGDPLKRILGQWTETIDPQKYNDASSRPKERLIFFFRDGTGVIQILYPNTDLNSASSFTWVLSEDGKLIKTEDRQGRVFVARVVSISDRALRIEGPSHVNGTFVRVP